MSLIFIGMPVTNSQLVFIQERIANTTCGIICLGNITMILPQSNSSIFGFQLETMKSYHRQIFTKPQPGSFPTTIQKHEYAVVVSTSSSSLRAQRQRSFTYQSVTTFDLFLLCSWNGGNKHLLSYSIVVHALDYEMIVCPLYLAHASDQCAVAFRTPSLGSFPSRCFGLRATKDVSYSLIFAWAVLNYAQAFYD